MMEVILDPETNVTPSFFFMVGGSGVHIETTITFVEGLILSWHN